MPGIAWVLVVVWGLVTGSALLGPPAIWKGKDPTARTHLGRPAAVEYRTWTSSPEILAGGVCRFTVFALVTRNTLTRLRINGTEQLLDWSWSWTAELPPGYHGEIPVEFLDPVGGAVLAAHTVAETCYAAGFTPVYG